MAEKEIGLSLEIEVEYQSETIGKYGLEFEVTDFSYLLKPIVWPKKNAVSQKLNQ